MAWRDSVWMRSRPYSKIKATRRAGAFGQDAFGEPRVTRQYTDNLPEVHDVLRELRQVTDQYLDVCSWARRTLGSIAELARMYGRNNDEIQSSDGHILRGSATA